MLRLKNSLLLAMLVVLLLALFRTSSVLAEPPSVSWDRTYGAEEPDWGNSVVQTTDGGYAIAAATGYPGESDFWLIKTDWQGFMEWGQTYGGTYDEFARSVVQTNDGGYAIAGYTDDPAVSSGGLDFWLVKTDSVGNKEWDRTYGGSGSEEAWSVVQTTDGGYALTGSNGWIFKTGSSGFVEWSQIYAGNWKSIVQTTDGGYAIAGGPDFRAVKIDSSGSMQWDKTYDGAEYNEAFSIVQTTDGGYAIAGITWPDGSNYDFRLVKTDSAGNKQWDRTYGGSGAEGARSVVQTNDGGYAVAGFTGSYSPEGKYDLWLVKTDSSGNMQWSINHGGSEYDEAGSVVESSDGGYVLAGYEESFEPYAGLPDVWLVKVGGTEAYDVTIGGYCHIENTPVSVSITMDGSPTGFTTPHTFTGLTGTHTFTVPDTDASGHPFKQWSTGETSTTITVSSGETYTAYYGSYDVTIKAHCNTEGVDVGVSITMDGSPTGFTTPHTFTGLTGTHTFTVPITDPNGHPFKQWSTGETSTTITVSSGETYTAYYELLAFGPRLDDLYGRILEGPVAQNNALVTGAVDIWFDIEDPAIVRTLMAGGYTMSVEPEMFQFYYIAFNVRDQLDPSGGGGRWRTSIGGNDALYYTYSGAQYENYVPLDDQAFRHALAHLIPKATIEAAVYGGVTGRAIDSTVPEVQSAWHNPDVDGNDYSVSEAISILQGAGYVWQAGAPNPVLGSTPAEYWGEAGNWIDPHTGEPMNHITFAGVTAALAPKSWLRDDMCVQEFNAIGLPIEHVVVAYSVLTDAMMDYHQFDMYALGCIVGRFPDHLYSFFHSSHDIIEGYNTPGIHNLTLNAVLETIEHSTDVTVVKEACWDAQDMLAQLCVYLPTITTPSISAFANAKATSHTDTLQGIVTSPGYGAKNDWTFYDLRWASRVTPTNPYGIGGTATYVVGSSPDDYHPGYASTADEWSVISRLFDGLINMDPYAHADIPWLATSWTVEDWTEPTSGNLGMNTTFWLRDDVYWHDDVKFTAHDVEFGLEFTRDQQIGRYLSMWQHLIDVQVHDEYTVSVYHNATSLWIFYEIASTAALFPEHIYAGTGPTFRPEATVNPINPQLTCLIGTGPFIYRDLGMPILGQAAHLVAYRPAADPTMGITTHWFMSMGEEDALLTEMFHWVGDVNRDGIVDIYDLARGGKSYGLWYWQEGYDEDADIAPETVYHTPDGCVEGRDMAEIGKTWGEQRKYP